MNKAAMTVPRRAHKAAVAHKFLGMREAPDTSFSIRRVVENNATTRETRAKTEIVIGFLHEALGTAIISILRYKRHYFMATEIRAQRVKATLLQHVAEEQAHADQLAERINQLGGQALLPFERLPNRNHAEQVEEDSLAEMIRVDLLAERSAIHNYRAMIASIGADDPTTRQVLGGILVQEEAHAENLASLLRDWTSTRERR